MANQQATMTPIPLTNFSVKRLVMIGAAFGSLFIIADVYDEKTAMWIGASLFAVMLFTTDMGSYLAHSINAISRKAALG
jgi:hypothetical protein